MGISYTFDDSAKSFILEAFGKKANDQAVIVEADATEKAVHAIDGQEITVDKFAGIRKGSEIYIRSDIISLVELADILKKD